MKLIAPVLPNMAPNTALGLLLGGVTLRLLQPLSPGRLRRSVGLTCACGLALMGAGTLLQHLVGDELGFEMWLWRGEDPPLEPS